MKFLFQFEQLVPWQFNFSGNQKEYNKEYVRIYSNGEYRVIKTTTRQKSL